MRNNEKNNVRETGNMLALSAASMNVLILAILVIGTWGIFSFFSNDHQLREFARGFDLLQ